MSKEYKRQDYMRHIKLGKQKRKVAWRKPTGRHSKIRQKLAGYPSEPTIGCRTPKAESGKIRGLIPVLVHNLNELSKIEKSKNIAIIARVGARKKLDLTKKAESLGVKVLNIGGKK